MVGGDISEVGGLLLASFSPGSRVAGYVLKEQIGAGGMAVVFRAVDERLGRAVALKILAPALASDESFRHRFIRESRAAAAVDDPHIIPVHQAGEADGVLFIAMRYVPGRDVRTLLHREGPLQAARAAAIISAVASALDAAHAAGLVHRDVKPANMLVDVRPGRPDHVYLSDFGISKRALSSVGLTRAGEYLGTPDYIAPEQIQGEAVDGRSDQYSLACAAFEMLTGEPPFRRDDPMAVIWAQLSVPPPPVADLRPDLPAAVDEVFARALAKARAGRFSRCLEFAEALRAALGLAPYHAGPDVVTQDSAGDEHSGTLIVEGGDAGTSSDHTPAEDTDHRAGGIESDATLTSSSVPRPPDSPGEEAAGEAGDTRPRRRDGDAASTGEATRPSTDPTQASEDSRERTADHPVKFARRRRLLAILAGVAIVASAGVAAPFLLAHPRPKPTPPPVLRPQGLTVGTTTYTTVQISWSGPAKGPEPSRYVVFQNGVAIGWTLGSTTSYQVTGLTPGTAYSYQLRAVRGHRRSPLSESLVADTPATPALSAAILTGSFHLRYRNASWYGWNKHNPLTSDFWRFTPRCATASCPIRLHGALGGIPFAATLRRGGHLYTGTAVLTNYSTCTTNNYATTDYLTIHLKIVKGNPQGTRWDAAAIAGDINLYVPPQDGCHSFGVTAKVSGGRG